MTRSFLAAALFLSFSASSAGAAEVQRSKYVPCPVGMEGKCGDIPGAISSAVGAGEIICDETRFQSRRRNVVAWAAKVRQVKTSVLQIKAAVDGLGNQYSPEGKRPPLSQTSDYIVNDLLARLINPVSAQLDAAAPCYAQNGMSSDSCHHLSCGDPETIMRNLENMGPAISRIDADLEYKRGDLDSGLPTSVMVGTAPNRYDKCRTSPPQHPCEQLMDRSITQIVQATQAVARTVGQLSGQ